MVQGLGLNSVNAAILGLGISVQGLNSLKRYILYRGLYRGVLYGLLRGILGV